MTAALRFVPPRIAFTDANGVITREWFMFLQGVFDRIGGATGTGNNTLDEFMQFDVREADAGEINKQLDELRIELSLLPNPTAAVVQLRRITDDLQEIADSLGAAEAARSAELVKRCEAIETLGAFTR